jgi:hypothetical protein
MLNALLADAAVAVSVALQHGVSGEALARSVGRLPANHIRPADLDHPPEQNAPASPIGAALDLITIFEKEVAK